MDEKSQKISKYETKLEKLTFFRIFVVLLCEIIFEFSFGLAFFFFSEYDGYYSDQCENLVFWARTIWKLYLAEFTVAVICFLIGILSLICSRQVLTKVYIAFNNFFKSIIFFASIIILTIVFIVYNEEENCNKLGDLTFYWLAFHFSLLSFAFIAGLTILIATLFFYYKSKKKRSDFHDYISIT